MPETLWAIPAGLFMLIGLIGTLLPAVPDLVLIWATALGYGLLAGWGDWGPWLFAGISLLCGVGLLSEVLTSSAGARIGGASVWSIIGGAAAGVILLEPGWITKLWMIVFVAGIFLLEWRKGRDTRRAGQAVLGTAVGYVASFFVKFALGFVAVGLWVIWVIVA